jgi:hypothetical protein
MHFIYWLIVAAAFMFVICLSMVKIIWDLLQVSIYGSPAIPEPSRNYRRAEDQPLKRVNRRVQQRD